MTDDILKVLISENEIKQKVQELGKTISSNYEGKNVLVLGVLKGSFVFMADLIRELSIPVEVEFMAVSSYHSGVKTSGVVKIIKDIDINPQKGTGSNPAFDASKGWVEAEGFECRWKTLGPLIITFADWIVKK